MSKKKFKQLKQLGSGEYGKVFLVQDKDTAEQFALKRISKRYIRKYKIQKDIQLEVEIHRKLDHENIIRFYDYYEDSKFVYFLLELAEDGDLFNLDVSEEADEIAYVETEETHEEHENNQVTEELSEPSVEEEEAPKKNNKRSRNKSDRDQRAKPEESDEESEEESHNEVGEESITDKSSEDEADEVKEIVVTNKETLEYKYNFEHHFHRKEAVVAKFVKQLIVALQYLHKNRIVHRDIKLENILLGKDGTLKIADFGFSWRYKGQKDVQHEQCGTTQYIPPENVAGRPYRFSPDIWAVGVFAYDMMFYRTPFKASKKSLVKKRIQACKITFPKNMKYSQLFKDFILKILVKNPKKRISLNRMLEHPWIKNFAL